MSDLIDLQGQLAAQKREAHVSGNVKLRERLGKDLQKLSEEIRRQTAKEHDKAGTKPSGSVPTLPSPQTPKARVGFWMAACVTSGVGLMQLWVTYGDRLSG